MMMESPPCSAGISSPPLTAVTVTVPYGSSLATAAVSTEPGSVTPIVTSTNMSFDVLPTIRKNPRLEWRIASDTARLAALVESLPGTSTPMPLLGMQRTRAIFWLLLLGGEGHRYRQVCARPFGTQTAPGFPGAF